MYKSKPAGDGFLFDAGHHIWISVAGLILLALLAHSGCAKSKEDKCKATEQTLIEPWFRFHFIITRMNGDPYLGEVNFQSQKHYCDGTVKGAYNDAAATTQSGYWKPITTQYKLANSEDFVSVKFFTNSYAEYYYYPYDAVKEGARLDETFQLVFEDTIRIRVN